MTVSTSLKADVYVGGTAYSVSSIDLIKVSERVYEASGPFVFDHTKAVKIFVGGESVSTDSYKLDHLRKRVTFKQPQSSNVTASAYAVPVSLAGLFTSASFSIETEVADATCIGESGAWTANVPVKKSASGSVSGFEVKSSIFADALTDSKMVLFRLLLDRDTNADVYAWVNVESSAYSTETSGLVTLENSFQSVGPVS